MRLEFLNSPRVQGALLAMALCMPLFFLAQDWWSNYWILKDGQTGTALVTGSFWGGHGNMNYLYTVNEKQYTGHSPQIGKTLDTVVCKLGSIVLCISPVPILGFRFCTNQRSSSTRCRLR